MAGTRLVIHTTFVIELFALIVISLLYASNKTSHGEPFIIDRSGWKHVIETVSPVNHTNTVIDRIVHASHSAWVKLDRLLLGNDGFTKEIVDVRSPSAFVHEMKRAVSSEGELWKSPPLTIEMSMPQLTSNATLHALAMALERGLQRKHPLLSVSVVKDEAEDDDVSAEVGTSSSFCDEWTASSTKRHRDDIQRPQLIILTECSSRFYSASEEKAVFQMSREDPILILRIRHDGENSYSHLQLLLEEHVASILSNILEIHPAPTHSARRLTSLSVEMIDENPTVRSESFGNDGSAKVQLEYFGEMFDSLVQLLVQPLLKDLSLIFGGARDTQRRNVPVRLSTHLSAYLPLAEDMIERRPNNEDGNSSMTNYVSTRQLSEWVNKHWGPNPSIHTRNPSAEDLHWVFYKPDRDHTPLMIRDDSTGEEGSSITFSLPDLTEGSFGRDTLLSGFSVVNMDPGSYLGMDGDILMPQPMQPLLQNAIAAALLHLIGYIRAFHGLSPVSTNYANKSTPAVSVSCCIEPGASETHRLSFWEMESIARNHWYSVLEHVLYETDALMSLLHTHGGSLAFPEHVAHTLNNATHLLRYSISLAEQGYPAIYSTSALYDSLRYIEEVRTHPELMELPHFAFDHYLAVFSPLVLPLVMPMMIGLVREWKRFKKLRSKAIESSL